MCYYKLKIIIFICNILNLSIDKGYIDLPYLIMNKVNCKISSCGKSLVIEIDFETQ